MKSPPPAAQAAAEKNPVRRLAATVILGGLVFATLWIMAFGWLTSLLIGAGCCAVMVAASSASDIVEMILDALATAVLAVLAFIAAIFAAILGLFGF
jgi:hypothetical protein